MSGVNATNTTNTGGASSSNPTTASQQLTQTYDQFLKLLTTQLRNQNPLSPTDSTQFTQQLVQYSQVEQQINTNSKLDTLISTDKTNQILQSSNFLGATVEANGSQIVIEDTTGAQFGYTLNSATDKLTAVITDSNGNEIRSTTLTPATGHNIVTWDGTNDFGGQVSPGLYHLAVYSGTGANQTAVATTTIGKVTNVQIANGAPLLSIGPAQVKLSDVVSVNRV